MKVKKIGNKMNIAHKTIKDWKIEYLYEYTKGWMNEYKNEFKKLNELNKDEYLNEWIDRYIF